MEKLEYDPLVKYFQDIAPLSMPLYKKGDVTFAGMGKKVDFNNMIKKICQISSFKTINDYSKDKFCIEVIKESPITWGKPKDVKDFFEMNTWNETYKYNILDSIVGKIKFKDKTIALVNIRPQTIVAKPLTLKGVDFEVHFEYEGDQSFKVLAGMLLDGHVPMTYYTIQNRNKSFSRYATFLHLSKITLVPINKDAYYDQQQELFKTFQKKFPDLKLDRSRREYFYTKNRDTFEMLYQDYKNFILYNFDNNKFGEKYSAVFMKKRKEELMKKHDDSDSI